MTPGQLSRYPIKPKADPDDAPWVLLRVDVSQLERARINPDEDHFLVHNFCDHERVEQGERACRALNVPFPPSEWLWEWGAYLRLPLPSLGDWADAIGLGDDPATTRYSISRGSIAYNGVVPAAAITIVQTSVDFNGVITRSVA
jgi:hypothetical protein